MTALAQIIGRKDGLRVFELIVNVSSGMEGTIDDWPKNIQDGIYAAMERVQNKYKISLMLTHATCEFDVDTGWFIKVHISETRPKITLTH